MDLGIIGIILCVSFIVDIVISSVFPLENVHFHFPTVPFMIINVKDVLIL